MEKFGKAPQGAPGSDRVRTGKGVPGSATPSGWRKATAGLAVAEQHARAGEEAEVDKTRAFTAIKRVGPQIGLKAGDMLLLDTLGAFTQAQDWAKGQRPIVWASNAYLMERTGFSLSALKRHARRLCDAGVVSFKDSPNGKRWGHRDERGAIVEAYGFDLSPLSARAAEFEELSAVLQAERDLCQRLKRQITVARRMIRARIEAAISAMVSGPWTWLTERFEELLGELPRRMVGPDHLRRVLDRFRALQEQVEETYFKAGQGDTLVENVAPKHEQVSKKTQEMDPRKVNSGPHILTTNELDPVTCNSSEKEEAAGSPQETSTVAAADGALEEWLAEVRKKRAALDVATVMQACPEFSTWVHNLGGYVKDWSDLHRAAGDLRPMIGVSEHAWNVAQERLGKQVATAALALVFEKHSTGEVSSPGGYLRGMVEKAGAGELHLERSFYGRLSGQAA